MINLSTFTHADPEILSGTLVFVGTRVPVNSLFDYLKAGDSLEEFLRQFPSVQRQQVIAVLEAARESVTTSDSRYSSTSWLPRQELKIKLRHEHHAISRLASEE